jgi:hypothetical protein
MMIGIGTPRSQSKIPRPKVASLTLHGANIDGQQTVDCLNLFQKRAAHFLSAFGGSQ